jgi:hypothetical protein
MCAINKDETPGGEHEIRRDGIYTNPVCCLDNRFTAVQVQGTHSHTIPDGIFVVWGDMLFR